jgi:hypothetical protein
MRVNFSQTTAIESEVASEKAQRVAVPSIRTTFTDTAYATPHAHEKTTSAQLGNAS